MYSIIWKKIDYGLGKTYLDSDTPLLRSDVFACLLPY